MRMKNIVCLGLAVMAGFAFADGADDSLVTFSTVGPDRYADGTQVMDGECYALVWSRDGVFEGLSADGQPIDPSDKVVLIAPFAENGRCPDVLFQLPATLASSLASGVYDVLLLDTRVTANGKTVVRGAPSGTLSLVNGYGAVADGLTIAKGTSGQLNTSAQASAESGAQASVSAAAPKSVAQPRIKHIRIEGNNVFLTVENLPGFMRVQGGTTIAAADTTGAATVTDGGANDVILVMPKTGNSGFFRVVRN